MVVPRVQPFISALPACASVNKSEHVCTRRQFSGCRWGPPMYCPCKIMYFFLCVACVIALLWMLFSVDFGSLHTSSVVGILYQMGLVLRILDFPLCKYESCSQKVTAINNLSSLCVSPIRLTPLIPGIIISHHGPQRGTPRRSYGAETRGAAADGRVV